MARPDDRVDFGVGAAPRLHRAADDLAWLLDRGYARPASLRLVGDRHHLNARQRKAVSGASAPAEDLVHRRARRRSWSQAAGHVIWIDGLNALLTIATALGGGPVFRGRDGALRDLAGLSRLSRRPEVAGRAIDAVGSFLRRHDLTEVRWLLDAPVSWSGRLRGRLEAAAIENDWSWTIELVPDPDKILQAEPGAKWVVTADGPILDQGVTWLDLPGPVIEEALGDAAWIVVL